MTAARTSKLATMKKTVADRIGLDIDNPAVTDIARLELAMSAEDAALEAGRNFNSTNLLNLRAALHDAYKAAGALQPCKIEIGFVEAVQGYYECVHCLKANYLDPGRYEPLTGEYKPTAAKPEATPSPAPAMPLESPAVAQDAREPQKQEKTVQREPDRQRGEYIGPSGHIEVLPLKRLEPPQVVSWRNPDPADAQSQPVEQHAGLIR